MNRQPYRLQQIFSIPEPGFKVKLPTIATLSYYFKQGGDLSTTNERSQENKAKIQSNNINMVSQNPKQQKLYYLKVDHKDNIETDEICKFYKNGSCSKKEDCAFSHGSEKTRYKSQMCAKFQQGRCKYGKTCSFAHGRTDLR